MITIKVDEQNPNGFEVAMKTKEGGFEIRLLAMALEKIVKKIRDVGNTEETVNAVKDELIDSIREA